MIQPATDPCAIVIFGASGDLAARKLLPALYALKADGRLPAPTTLVGFSRSETTDDAIRERVRRDVAATNGAEPDATAWKNFASGLYAFKGEYADVASFKALGERLAALDRERGTRGNRLFYLAVPPSAYAQIVANLGAAGLVPRGSGRLEQGWSRVIIEKPFGHDLASAHNLNLEIAKVLTEDQIYRIDHYLGKETVQNIIVLRFANGIFEPLWNRRYISDVQITVAETIGIGSRGRFYEEAGALRDIVQNHLLQLLALVAMEPPVAFDADAIRDEKVKVMKAIRPIPSDLVGDFAVRGQYGPGTVEGKPVAGYRREANVNPQSGTETYVAMRLFIDNWRWAGVPFYLRTGKYLPKTLTEIAIRYTKVPHLLFRDVPAEQQQPNELVLRIQPNEGIALRFGAKTPGPDLRIQPVHMDFAYAESFGSQPTPAYERLLLDAVRGDASLFIRDDGVDATWNVVQPILDVWTAAAPRGFPNYTAGSWGPKEADELLARDGRRWRNPD